ncbi:helix-turn-helix domain-containing protein [Rhizobium sp. Root1203]|uniref:helix-turn-helix domain-containing protein n=1 Tax=Rhizobium sp. Root1203 TaxID=1736427 RepID=UPI001FCD4521|nr:helix-turn-helix domain-containing protein [Rhizobium sp. Root1203]
MFYAVFRFNFLFSKIMPAERREIDWLGGVPVRPELGAAYPLVVYGGHRLCAGSLTRVKCMQTPHMHSQVEINFVLKGSMTYSFDQRRITVDENRFCLFWGMIPHQVVDCEVETEFVCLYLPLSMFLDLPNINRLRETVFRGSMIEPGEADEGERRQFLRWRADLVSGDDEAADIARQEISARVRRLARDDWRDLRDSASLEMPGFSDTVARMEHVERMLRFIGEHALEEIGVPDVAAHVGLHPNYATSLYRRALGMTINQSIIQHRLDTAQSLLACSDIAVTAVAFEAGFGSVSRFYQAFHRRFGIRPGAYRERIRNSRMS